MKPVFKYDMVSRPKILKAFKDAINDVKNSHPSAATYKVETLADAVLNHIATHLDELYKKVEDIADVVKSQETRLREAAAKSPSSPAFDRDKQGSRVWSGKVQQVELDSGDGVESDSGEST